MNRLTLVLLLGMCTLMAFVEGRGLLREGLFGTRIDVLPLLVLYAAMRGSLSSALVVSSVAGLLFDSLSANPLGMSLMTLGMIGVALIQVRGVILRDQALAQICLGAGVAMANPVLGVSLLWGLGYQPVVGWGTWIQIGILGISGAILAPLLFKVFDWLESELTYAEEPSSRFRSDVEIKRGRG
tara:strand:+ start:176 stop:727 length:552 start_codon:yes stop_codon:yes gene_type:complete